MDNLKTLPISVINKITEIASIMDDKMYIPTFDQITHKLRWKFNYKNTKIRKISKIFQERFQSIYYTKIRINQLHGVMYNCVTYNFYIKNKNKIKYMIIENIKMPYNAYVLLKYHELFGSKDGQVLFMAYMYQSFTNNNKNLLKIQPIKKVKIDTDNIMCFTLHLQISGYWNYNSKLQIMEFRLDYIYHNTDSEDSEHELEYDDELDYLLSIPQLEMYM